MDLIKDFVDFIIHIDRYLAYVIQEFGSFTYLILFLVIFCETGLVVTPFLPGDSLLFVIGAFSVKGVIDFKAAYIILFIAATGGNVLNYAIGRTLGVKVLNLKISRSVKKEYLDKTSDFYKKHGGKAIILSRYLPVVRTFAPFVAGVSKMSFVKFFGYNLIGSLTWVTLFLAGGYFFGNIPFIKENFSVVIFTIAAATLVPAAVAFLKTKLKWLKKVKNT
jgi:membrane-associated protein